MTISADLIYLLGLKYTSKVHNQILSYCNKLT
jgi:hypothetical protein